MQEVTKSGYVFDFLYLKNASNRSYVGRHKKIQLVMPPVIGKFISTVYFDAFSRPKGICNEEFNEDFFDVFCRVFRGCCGGHSF